LRKEILLNGGLPFESGQTSEGDWILTFRTPLTFEHAGIIWEELTAFLKEKKPSSLVFDLSDAVRIDSAGIALLRTIRRSFGHGGVSIRFESAPPSIQQFLDHIEKLESPRLENPPITIRLVISWLGWFILDKLAELHRFILFVGDFFRTAAGCLRHFRRFRWREMFYYFQLSGANAMNIVFLVSFLLGLVMSYQAAIQLRQFGANIFVADLLSLAVARELAPVFTAIILAGRSGSAFAAEIGTMKVGEELDALAVMGFNLTEFITVPKVFALMLCAPLLTMWSNFAGILGGIVVGSISLDLTVYSFLHEIYEVLEISDLASGLIKAEFFAILISLIGCFRGFETEMSADSVGRQTTSAVVSGLFLIIFADAIFTVIFHEIGW
jgi:phospholipid/cholesterol/gamma-HCH transport system permease protein